MRQFLLLSILAICFLVPKTVQATHIVGGEMTYKCLGNDTFEIKLTVFRDCLNGQPPFDSPASIGVFNSNNEYIKQSLVPWDLSLNDTLQPMLLGECFTTPPDVCVHTTTYTTKIHLPFIPGGYQLVYQRCCRNQTIVNIQNPLDVGATFSINVTEAALLTCNSSPVFDNYPPLYICVNYPMNIDQSATDPDGDSLVYKLCAPLTGATPALPMPQPPNNPPYPPVPWVNPPYDVNNMLNGVGGGEPMKIDPVTGLVTGIPTTIGQFVFGICIEEYRNGELISVSRRDYQVNVGDCGVVTAAFFAPAKICDTYTVSFNNSSTNSDNYVWFFNDPANPGAMSNLEEPMYTYSDTGTYNILLIAEPGTVCTDTAEATIQIFPNSLFANFSTEAIACADSLTLQINDSSIDTATNLASWQWVLFDGVQTQTSSEQSPLFYITEQGTATLTLTVTSDNGCSRTLTETFPVDFIEDNILEETLVCHNGGGVFLNPDGSFPGATYLWQPSSSLDNPTSPNPFATPDSTTVYSVTITDSGSACVVEKNVTVVVSPIVEVTPVLDTILAGTSVQIMATDDPTYMYQWTPPTGLNATNIPNPVATPETDITYTLVVTDQNGCVVERSVKLVLLALCEEPYLFIPTGFSPNNDGKNDTWTVIGNNITELYLAVYDRWGELIFETDTPGVSWDGTYKGKQLAPDSYGYYTKLRCAGGLEFTKKGNVTLVK